MLQPLVRRTWAPRGQTPVMYCWDRHDRLSVISALSVSARRHRIGLYFTVQGKNVRAEQVESFLRQVQRSLGCKLIVVLDRWSVHRKAAHALIGDGRFWIESLPPYAPDLNPVEAVWSHTKYADLANFIPEDLADLEREVDYSLWRAGKKSELLRSFFQAAELQL